jgi:carboxypeptidase C (cathepsin A)
MIMPAVHDIASQRCQLPVIISVLLAATHTAEAAPAEAKVIGLPGWAGELPSPWYSGFLPVGASKKLHYVFVEAEVDPANKPLLLWLNGGPGCSSLDGLMYEHGPLLVSHDGAKLVRNPFAWSTMANVLYLEAPAGVGFSWSTNPSDYHTGANQTSTDNMEALLQWYELFPEYRTNRFMISGESYGGIYVPTLSSKVFESGKFPQFAGFLVGNGAWGGDCGNTCEGGKPCAVDSHLQFLYGHGAVSDRLFANISRTCGAQPNSRACDMLQEQADSMGRGLNGYDFYRDCYAHDGEEEEVDWKAMRRGGDQEAELAKMVRAARPMHPAVRAAFEAEQQHPVGAAAGAGTRMNVPCIDSDGGTTWLNNPAVKEALHVAASPQTWSICNAEINEEWDRSEYPAGMPPLYSEMAGKVEIMVYNGDVDPACDYVSNQRCIDGLEIPVAEPWRPWKYSDPHVYDPSHAESGGVQTGGWVTKYAATSLDKPLYFLTIKGAGHMVPQWKPRATATWLGRFLNGTAL